MLARRGPVSAGPSWPVAAPPTLPCRAAPPVASATAIDLVATEEVGAASAPSGRRRNSKGKGSKGGGGEGGGGGGGSGGGGGGGSGGGGGAWSGGFSGGGGGSGSGGGGGGGSGTSGGGSVSGGGGNDSGGGGGGGGGDGRGAAAQRGGFGGSQRGRRGETCGLPHTAQRCFGHLSDAWRAQFSDAVELPCWGDLLRQNVAIFDLDFDAILAAKYAVTDSAEDDCYLSVLPDPSIEATALGASASAALGTGESAAPGVGESALFGTPPTEALHTFTLESGASRSFFRDSTTLTPLSRPDAVSLADPSGGPVLAHSSTVLPCPAAPSGLLSGLHLPSFSMNLVSGADLHDAWVDQFTPGGQRVTHCTCSRTGRHLATFTRRPGSSLYTLTTVSPPVTSSGQVAASSQVFAATSGSSPASAPCSCRPLSHETLLWHHRLGHPSLPRLRGMASRTLVSGLPRSLPPLPPGPAPTCVPCVEGRQRVAPHSSTFPPREAPLQTLHMDVWGPARVRGQGHERYFLLVVDDYSHSTRVFPLRSKGDVTEVLIGWIRSARRQLSERFGSDLPVLSLHSDRGGEFSSDLLRAFCCAEGIRQTFTLPASPQQNGIAERHIGMVMDVACTSMIHAAAPHFLWPFAVQYAAHQINLEPRVSLPETTSTLRWTGKGTSCPPVPFPASSLASPLTHPGGSSTTPPRVVFCPLRTSRLTSRCVTTVSFPTALPLSPPPPLFLAPDTPPVDPLPSQGPAPSGVSQIDPAEPVEVAVDSGAATGAEPADAGTRGAELERVEPGGAEPGGAESGSAEPGGAEPERVEPGGAEPGGTTSGGTEPERAESGGPPATGGATSAGAAGGATGAGAAGGVACVGAAGGAGAAVPGGARTGGTGGSGAGGSAGVGAAGTRAVATRGASGAGAVGGTGAGGAMGVLVGDPRDEGTGAVSTVFGGAARPRPYYVPLFQQGLGLPPSPSPTPPFQSQSQLQPASPLPGPSPYSGPTRCVTERREPESHLVSPESRPASPESRSASPVRTACAGHRVSRPRPPPDPDSHSRSYSRPRHCLSRPASPESRSASPVRTACAGHRVSRPRSPPDPDTHSMTLHPSNAPQHVPLPSPPASSLPDGPNPESDSLRAASPTVPRFLATASASASVCPPFVEGECALGTDVLEDRQEEFECFAAAVPHLVSMLLAPEGDPDAPDIPTPRSYAEAIEGPYSSQWQAAMDAEMASWKSTGTYVDEVPPQGANIVSGMWIFRVKRPPGSPPTFKARYVARGFSQRQGVDFFQTFSPTPKMATLRVLLHVVAQHDYDLHSLDFSTAFLQGSLHEEIWLRRPRGFTGSFPAGTQWSLWRPVYGLRQAPYEWHDTMRTTLAALGFAPSTADPSLFLRTDTTLPPFYVLVYVDNLVFATAATKALAHGNSELQKRHTCTDMGELTSYLGLRITRDRAQRTITLTQSHMVQQFLQRFGFTYSSPQSTPLPTGHSLSAPPSDESLFLTSFRTKVPPTATPSSTSPLGHIHQISTPTSVL
ncbi:unnamed protein product [Closterium sp. NIES-54]